MRGTVQVARAQCLAVEFEVVGRLQLFSGDEQLVVGERPEPADLAEDGATALETSPVPVPPFELASTPPRDERHSAAGDDDIERSRGHASFKRVSAHCQRRNFGTRTSAARLRRRQRSKALRPTTRRARSLDRWLSSTSPPRPPWAGGSCGVRRSSWTADQSRSTTSAGDTITPDPGEAIEVRLYPVDQ